MSELTEERARAPNPPFFLAAKNGDGRAIVSFCRNVRPRAFFFGGMVDDKMECVALGMGCQNRPKNEHVLFQFFHEKTVWRIRIDIERRR